MPLFFHNANMKKVVLNYKTGFESEDSFIDILNENLQPFYEKENINIGGKINFNLPIGTYYTNNNLTKLKKPVAYILPYLPPPQKHANEPKKLKIVYCDNPNKCSIDLETGTVFMDEFISDKTQSERTFVLYHELGHYKYLTESLCDLYAVYKMIELGYNPSQCNTAGDECLSEYNQERKNKIYNFSKNIKRI